MVATNFLPAEGVVFLSALSAVGRGGGGISDVALSDDTTSFAASSPDSGGRSKRAVGRDPDAEGPLGFFKIGCGGGGREDDGVGCFGTTLSVELWEFSRSDPALLLASADACFLSWSVFWSLAWVSRRGYKERDGRRHTGRPSYRLVGPFRGTNVGPSEISLKILARTGPGRFRRSLPQTCHQKYSSREAVGSTSLRKVVV